MNVLYCELLFDECCALGGEGSMIDDQLGSAGHMSRSKRLDLQERGQQQEDCGTRRKPETGACILHSRSYVGADRRKLVIACLLRQT